MKNMKESLKKRQKDGNFIAFKIACKFKLVYYAHVYCMQHSEARIVYLVLRARGKTLLTLVSHALAVEQPTTGNLSSRLLSVYL